MTPKTAFLTPRMRTATQFRDMVVAALLLVTTTSCLHVGQRLLTFQIELDGQVVFEGNRGVPDNMAVDRMWDILGNVSFEATTEQEHPVHLEGNVVVRIKHVDHELTSAKLKAISLQPDASGSQWSLSEDRACVNDRFT